MAVGRYGSPEAVVLDVSPVANYLLRQQQEKKLMQQQLDRQVNEDLSKLSLDGARPQDISVIRQRYDAFRDAAIQYKKALRDPKTRDTAEQNYINAKTQLNTLVAESKGAKEVDKQIYDFYGKNRDQINEDEFRKAIGLRKFAIGTPEYNQAKDYDMSSIAFKPEQFQADKWENVINTAIKPQTVTTPTKLPNGQIEVQKKRMVDPRALSEVISGLYDSDLGHGKKYWDSQFGALQPEDKSIYEDYMNKYLPGFEITTPKELAIAAKMYGRIEQDLGAQITGTDRSRIEAFQRQMQAEREARADARQAKSLAAQSENKNKEDYYVEDDIAANMANNNRQGVIAPFKSVIAPGNEVAYIREGDGINDKSRIDRMYNQVKKYAKDAETKLMTREQFGKGVIVVQVPSLDKDKNPIPGQYQYMAVSRVNKNPQSRINALLNYASGGATKLLPSKYYKGKLNPPAIQQQTIEAAYTPGQFDDVEEEN